MNSITKVTVAVVTLLSLTACGGSDIDVIKSVPFAADQNLTTGQALDNRPMCDEITWTDLGTDDYDRPIVEYRCSLKGAPEYFAAKTDVVKVEEVFQWTFTEDAVFYTYGAMQLTREDGSIFERVLMTYENAMNGGTHRMSNVLKEVVEQKYSSYKAGADRGYFPWPATWDYRKESKRS